MTPLSQDDWASVALYPELLRLVELRASPFWNFMPVVRDGVLVMVVGARVWRPERWQDAIAIKHRDDARASRCDPAGGEVWWGEGGLAEVIDGLVERPEPGHRDAPHLVKGTAPKLWVPGMT